MKSKAQIQYITDFRLFGKDHFYILKGISILFVVLAHFFDRYLNMPGLLPLQGIAAAVFLLCSGYGVSESFKSKNGLTHYWENKALKVWLPSLVAVIASSLLTQGDALSWVANNPLALYGWFLYLLMGEYLAFWLAFKFFENKTVRLCSMFALSVLAFFVIKQQELAVQTVCFPIGVTVSQLGLKYKFRKRKIARQVLITAVPAVLFVGAYLVKDLLSQPLAVKLVIMLFCVSGAIFLSLGVYLGRKIPVFGIFAPLGTVSFGLYLLHEVVLSLLHGRMEGRVIAAVFMGLLVLSAVFSWLCRLLVEFNKKLRRRKKTQLKGSMW